LLLLLLLLDGVGAFKLTCAQIFQLAAVALTLLMQCRLMLTQLRHLTLALQRHRVCVGRRGC
jgi:hypothetical protein